MQNAFHILGFAGSLRKRSFNRALLNAAIELAPDSLHIETFDLAPIPLYNADLDTDEKRPEPVTRFKGAIADADGLLIATPEYNMGTPGLLKNALDWASRPAFRSVLVGKPVAIMGASPGKLGTARGQEQLKLTLLGTLARVLPHPGVYVGEAKSKFDEDLRLTDESTRSFVTNFLEELQAFCAEHLQAKEA